MIKGKFNIKIIILQSLIEYIDNKIKTAKFNFLKRKTSTIAKKNNNELYLKYLIKFDKSIIDIRDNIFIRFLNTHGKGEGTLDTFRILTKGEIYLFEKIYRSKSTDLENALFFHKEIYEKLIKNGTKTPSLYNIIKGNRINILLFEKNPHEKITNNEIYIKTALLCFKNLAKIDPIIIKSNIYSLRCYRKTIDFCNENKIDKSIIFTACKLIEKTPLFFAHSDLHINNISADGTVYDWDNSGYFPAGYDLACVITDLEIHEEDEVLKIIKSNYHIPHKHCNMKTFTLSTLLLCFMLVSNRKQENKLSLYKSLSKFIEKNYS